MSHFYGVIKGRRGEATRAGTRASGLLVTAASWKGAIRVELFLDANGQDCFRVLQTPWHGEGVGELLAEGVLGQPTDCGVTP
jgi:hypothetical protein